MIKCKVFHDGSQYIAKLSYVVSKYTGRGINFDSEIYDKFKEFYKEAVEKYIWKHNIPEYIQECFMKTCDDIFDVPSIEEIKDFYKRYVSIVHKRMQRYRRKVYMSEWSYFVTFTYDSKKITQEQFEKQLLVKLQDLSSHHGWRYMAKWEDGEVGERRHLHAFIYVPEGKMIGELYGDKHYSSKKRKTEFFTNNTYFNNRFGISDWIDLKAVGITKSMINYFAKYMAKNDDKIIYSRGIVGEIEAVIEYDDIIVVYEKNYCFYGVLNRFLFMSKEAIEAAKAKAFDLSKLVTPKVVPI